MYELGANALGREGSSPLWMGKGGLSTGVPSLDYYYIPEHVAMLQDGELPSVF